MAPLIRFGDVWAIEAAPVAEATLYLTLVALASLYLLLAANAALVPLATGRVDPDDVSAILRADDGIDEALSADARSGDPENWMARRAKRFLVSRNRLRMGARLGMAQIGNADTPPMFKNFVQARLLDEDGGTVLELSA